MRSPSLFYGFFYNFPADDSYRGNQAQQYDIGCPEEGIRKAGPCDEKEDKCHWRYEASSQVVKDLPS